MNNFKTSCHRVDICLYYLCTDLSYYSKNKRYGIKCTFGF